MDKVFKSSEDVQFATHRVVTKLKKIYLTKRFLVYVEVIKLRSQLYTSRYVG